jgi:hypothetical protein
MTFFEIGKTYHRTGFKSTFDAKCVHISNGTYPTAVMEYEDGSIFTIELNEDEVSKYTVVEPTYHTTLYVVIWKADDHIYKGANGHIYKGVFDEDDYNFSFIDGVISREVLYVNKIEVETKEKLKF